MEQHLPWLSLNRSRSYDANFCATDSCSAVKSKEEFNSFDLKNLKKSLMAKLVTLLLVAMFITPIAGIGQTLFSGGSGTSASPYLISTLADLIFLSENSAYWSSGKYFKQTADIDASSTSTLNSNGSGGYYGFSPIGNSTTSFSANYNGDGKIIESLYINRPSSTNIGLFGKVSGTETVQNLGLKDVTVIGNGNVGGLVGNAEGTYFWDPGWWDPILNMPMGGGPMYYGGYFKQCYVSGTISGSGSNVGGVVGSTSNGFTFQNVYFRGSVGSSSASNIGGFVGISSMVYFSYCYTVSTVANGTNRGAFLGSGSTFSNSGLFFDSEVSGIATDIIASAKTTAQMKTQATFTSASWDFVGETANGSNNYWAMSSLINDNYPFLAWQADLPSLTTADADSITCVWALLGGNISADGGLSVSESGVVYSASDNTPQIGENGVTKQAISSGTGDFSAYVFGLNPSTLYYYRTYAINGVGTSYGEVKSFNTIQAYAGGTGDYNTPYKIGHLSDLVYLSTHSSDWNKQFEQIADIDASLTSQMNPNGSGGYYGFSPIGTNYTYRFEGNYDGGEHRISNLYINRPSTNNVGLFGFILWGQIHDLGLEDLSITGQNYVGGLFGNSDWGAKSPNSAGLQVERCYTTGSVSGTTYVGGFAGFENSLNNYTNCYSRCSVNGTQNIGGFISYAYGSYTNCYVAAPVQELSNYSSGEMDAGYYYVSAYACFYDEDVSGTHTAGGYLTMFSTPKSTVDMKTQSTFTIAGWDFVGETANGNSDIWKMEANTNDGYPAFTWQPASNNCIMTAAISAKTNVACKDGTTGAMTVTATSGTSPYTYTWSNGTTNSSIALATNEITGLVAGTYTVTVTDANNCTDTAYAVITQPAAALSASITASTNILCNGASTGAMTVTASGGTPSYTYQWSNQPVSISYKAPVIGNSISNLAAGTYTVTVTDINSCTDTAYATLTEPTQLLIGITAQTNVSCNGGSNGSLTGTTTGGTGDYSYMWSNQQNKNGFTYSSTNSNLTAGTYTVTVTDANFCTDTAYATITEPTALLASITSKTNVACNGGSTGSMVVTGSGGTGSYTYQWSNQLPGFMQTLIASTDTLKNVVAGTYTVTVTDANNCTDTAYATITEPTALAAGITSKTNVLCYGASTGGMTVTASGGTASYTYQWSNQPSGILLKVPVNPNSISNVAAGTYTVTVTDANNCTDTAYATITQPASAVSASITSKTDVACNGGNSGSLTVTAGGGVSPYSYSWSNDIPTLMKIIPTTDVNSSLIAGTYTVTVTDANNCTDTAYATITQPTALLASITSKTNVACFGGSTGSMVVTAAGGTGGYTYLWSNQNQIMKGLVITTDTLKNVIAGTYTVTVTDANNCTDTAYATITQPTALTAGISSKTEVLCNGASTGSMTVTASGGTANYTYMWSNQQSSALKIPINPAINSNLAAGTYTVTVTDANNCTDTAYATITEPTALTASFTAQTNVLCNGASTGILTITAAGGTGDYSYAWSNQAVKNGFTYSSTNSNLAAGTYTVTITDANLCSVVKSETITELDAIEVSVSVQTNVSCNGLSDAEVTVSVDGGVSPYQYQWSNAILPTKTLLQGSPTNSNLTAGTYTLAVTDLNACSVTYTVTITEPDELDVDLDTQIDVSCFGGDDGSITVTVSGGTEDYAYAWSHLQNLNKTLSNGSPTASSLIAGEYTVTVTDEHGCSDTYTTTVTEPDALVVSNQTQTNVSCNGLSDGEVTVSVEGGTPNFSYLWSNAIQPAKGINPGSPDVSSLSAGTYTVTVIDANFCRDSLEIEITEPEELTASITAQTNVSCWSYNDGEATVTAEGGTSPYNYQWSGGTPLTKFLNGNTAGLMVADDYTVTVTDNHGCTVTVDFTITEPDEITASAGIDQQICYDGTITLAGSYTVAGGAVWSGGTGTFDPDNTTMNAIYTPSADEIAAGTLTLTLTTTDNGPCNEASDELTITIYPEPRLSYTINTEAYETGTPIEICDGVTVDAVASDFVGTFPFQGKRQIYFNGSIFGNEITFNTSTATDFNQSNQLPIGEWTNLFTELQDAHGCITTEATLLTFSPMVSINPNPTAIIDFNDPVCEGETILLNAFYDEVACEEDCYLPGPYCQSYANIGTYQYIDEFILGKTSSANYGGFDKIALPIFKTLYLDSTYSVSVDIAGPMAYDHYTMIFVDWNRDGDFEDLDEAQQVGYSQGVGLVISTLSVPSNATLGKTMLRVINRKNFYPTACGNYTVGETEDYPVEIKSVDPTSITDYAWSGPTGLYSSKVWTLSNADQTTAGVYGLTVTNTHGCITETSHTVIVANPQIDFSTVETAQEAPFALQLNPGSFQHYEWSNGSSESSLVVNEFGTYSVVVSDYHCFDSESITINEVQIIPLELGWSLFSTYINQTADIEDVMSDFTDDIVIVKNNAGQTYWPPFTQNSIGNMVVGQGYQVKMSLYHDLIISGISVDPENTPISLNTGQNLIGMLHYTPVSAADVFAPVVQSLIYVKLSDGSVYVPSYGINQVVILNPDDAFRVFMLAPGQITYPANSQNYTTKIAPERAQLQYYTEPANSGSNMTLLIPAAVIRSIAEMGDEFAVVAATGRVSGAAVYEGETLVITIWGQDGTVHEKTGMAVSESFILEHYNHRNGTTSRYEQMEFEMGNNRFSENSLAVIKSLNFNLNLNLNLYPNPATDFVEVNLTLPEGSESQLEIYNGLGQVMFSKTMKEAGNQIEKISVSSFSSGIYTIRLRSKGEIREVSFVVK